MGLRAPGCENERENPLWVFSVLAGGRNCIWYWSSKSDNSGSVVLSGVPRTKVWSKLFQDWGSSTGSDTVYTREVLVSMIKKKKE